VARSLSTSDARDTGTSVHWRPELGHRFLAFLFAGHHDAFPLEYNVNIQYAFRYTLSLRQFGADCHRTSLCNRCANVQRLLKREEFTFTEPLRAKKSQRLSPSATGEDRRHSRLQKRANVFAHLNRCLRSHFFGPFSSGKPRCIKSQGGVAVCRASVGRSHEQSLLLRARCFHL
jgi:hypothetical protein